MASPDELKTSITAPTRRKSEWTPVWWSLSIGLSLFFMASCGFILPLELLITTVFGWCSFLVRVLPEMTFDWSGILTGFTFGTLFVFSLHFLAKSLHGRKTQDSNDPNPVWRWRWTWSLTTMVVLLFVAGIAMVGVTHQTGWLLTSPEPFLNKRFLAGRIETINDMRQIGLALHMHSDVYKSLPSGGTFTKSGQQLHGWQTALLPFIEQESLHKKIHLTKPWYDPINRPPLQTEIKTYLDVRIDEPTKDNGYALSHYTANSHVMHNGSPMKFGDITDGTSDTILFGGAAGNYKPWGHALNWRDPALGFNTMPDGFGGPSDDAIIIGMADGSVITVTSKMDPQVLKAISTPNGGEEFDRSDW